MAEKKIPFDQQKNHKGKNKKAGRRFKAVKIVLLVMLLVFLITGGTAAAVVANYVNDAPALDPTHLETVETSYLYDSSGEEVTALHQEQNRIIIELDEIPEHLKQAFIAIEDERFYSHFGFDLAGSIRAAYANFQAGRIVQGASTITQQLAQNAFLGTETSYERKVQEIWLAIQLERIYSKQEIMEMYLNRIYFGNGAYGVEAAAKTYFDKSAGELSISEAAMLAGAVHSPNYFNPFNNKEEAENRMKVVLANMARLEMITEEEYHEAANKDLSYAEPQSMEHHPYPYFVDYVIHHELIRILSADPAYGSRAEAYRAIYTGGLQVYTTLEPSMQSHVEDVLSREDLYPRTVYVDMDKAREAVSALPSGRSLTQQQLEEIADEEGLAQPQAAIVLADPTTGQIKALGGGREYRKDDDEVLRFTTLRQPGSAIKPITTYGPAFEEGVLAGAGSTLDDSPYIGPHGDWFPENFDYKFRGMTTAREALYYSYNIPAVRAFEKLGPQTGAEYAEKLGITTLHPDEVNNLSLTLGGFTRGVSVLDMTQAYSVFANDGLKINLHTVEKVVDRHGNTIYENQAEPEQVLSPQAAFLINDILQDFVTEYLGGALRIDRPVAAKTGTTDNWRDVLLSAYTPNLIASFWMGYDEPKMGSIQQGWSYSTNFLREVFLEAFEDLEVEEFETPDGIVAMRVCDKSGLRPNTYCESAGTVITDYFIEGNEPTGQCNMHEGRYYNRPPYIETDERWSSRGGPGRGPKDAEEMPSDPRRDDYAEEIGTTTGDITRFNAYIVENGIILQWEYDGPEAEGFELQRSVEEGAGSGKTVNLDAGSRQHTDSDIDENVMYAYSLKAQLPDGTISEPATVTVNTATPPGEGAPVWPADRDLDDEDSVVMPDVVGSFQALAESTISRAGLKVTIVDREYHDEIAANRVISQRPEAGTVVPKGREVRLTVSRGPE